MKKWRRWRRREREGEAWIFSCNNLTWWLVVGENTLNIWSGACCQGPEGGARRLPGLSWGSEEQATTITRRLQAG